MATVRPITHSVTVDQVQQQEPSSVKTSSSIYRPVRLAYQPPASSTFLSQQTSHQQSASNTFLSEQISTSHQLPAKRTGCTALSRCLQSSNETSGNCFVGLPRAHRRLSYNDDDWFKIEEKRKEDSDDSGSI
jgi:hypothetical protein